MALAHELTSPGGGPSNHFHIAEARLHLHRKCYQEAESCLRKAVTLDVQVSPVLVHVICDFDFNMDVHVYFIVDIIICLN